MEAFKRVIHPKDWLEQPQLLIEYIKVRADSGEKHFAEMLEALQKAEEECELELNSPQSSPDRAKWLAVKGDILRHRGAAVEAFNEYYNQARDQISDRAFESSAFQRAFDSFAEAICGQAFIYAFFRNEKKEALDLLSTYWTKLENHRADALKCYDIPIKPHLIQGLCYPLTNDINRKLAYQHLSVMIKGSGKDCPVAEFAFLDQILIAKAASTLAYLLRGEFKDIPHDVFLAGEVIDRWYEKLYIPEAQQVALSDYSDSAELFPEDIYAMLDAQNRMKLTYAKFQYDFADLACHAKDFWGAYAASASIHYKKAFEQIKAVYEYCEKNNASGEGFAALKAVYQDILFRTCAANEIAHVPYYHGPAYLPQTLDEEKFTYRIMNAVNYFGYNMYHFPLDREASQNAYSMLCALHSSPERANFHKLAVIEQMALAVGFVWLAEVVGNKKWGFDGDPRKARELLASAKGVFSDKDARYIIEERLGKFKKTLLGGYRCDWLKVRI